LRSEVIGEFSSIASTVAHLHEMERLIHRDIKPSNILIAAGGELRLADFGIVKSLAPAAGIADTSLGAAMGTPLYMAPEQCRAEAIFASDVYSLGVLLAELAAGERPAPDSDRESGSALADWRPLRQLPDPLRDLILACTAVSAKHRPETARELHESFMELVRNQVEPD
jgi:eukaryotic-like serine/threonine-protein kinase